MGGSRRHDAPTAIWALVLAVLALGPALGPGYVLVRDMVWVPDLALRRDQLGLGTGLPRAVPSDAVVAVLDEIVPGQVLQVLVLVSALAAGGIGAARLLGVGAGLLPRLVAVSVYGWNALVLERLLMGAWPVLLGCAALPWVLIGAQRWRDDGRLPPSILLLLPLGSLSPAAGLATAVALLAGAGRRRGRAVGLVVLANAPWAVAGILHLGTATSDARAARLFALHDEGSVPGPLAALTLGGIWNSDVVPATREGALGWVSLVVLVGLALIGLRRWWPRAVEPRRALVFCWAVGWGLAVLTWALPGAFGYAAAHIPGAGLVRDGARSLVLCVPLIAVLVAEGVAALVGTARSAARLGLGVAGVLLPVALLPGLALGAGGQLEPSQYPASYAQVRVALNGAPGDVLVLPLTSYRAPAWNDGRPVLDPLPRYLTQDYVSSDVLIVDGTALDGEDPRVVDAADALARPTPEDRADSLSALGIGAVVIDQAGLGRPVEIAGEQLRHGDLEVVVLDDVDERREPSLHVAAIGFAWAAFCGLLLGAVPASVAALVRARRGRRL